MYANYHTHTKLCNHASGEMREYVETAIKNKVKVLGFSDHGPYIFNSDYYSKHRMLPEETEGYVNNILKLREEYKKDIDILIGYEMEYYPSHFEDTMKFIRQFPCEYLILGQHFTDDEYNGLASSCKIDDKSHYAKYVKQVTDAIKTGVFSYVAHPDIARFTDDYEYCKSEAIKLCKCAKEHNLPLEINLLGIRDNRHYPNDKFWEIAAEIGNDVVIGCDAHSPEWTGDKKNVEDGLNYAKKFGFTPLETINLIKP